MTVPNAVAPSRELKQRHGDSLLLGSGTVTDFAQAEATINAGAVGFSLHPDVIAKTRQLGKVSIPGALTPTEVITAWRAGADYVKVFPCSAMGGANYLKALRAPSPDLKLIPTSRGNAANRSRISKSWSSRARRRLGSGQRIRNHRRPSRIHHQNRPRLSRYHRSLAQKMTILDRFRLDGKLALVTGAASGIGAAIAIALAEAGATVACHGNRRPSDETSARIREAGGKSQSFAADLSQPNGAESLYQAVSSAMGAPDILVNNAGTIYRQAAEEPRLSRPWMTVVQVNLNSVPSTSQLAGQTDARAPQRKNS